MKEVELERDIAQELGLEAFEAEIFEKEVERVDVLESGIRVVRKSKERLNV